MVDFTPMSAGVHGTRQEMRIHASQLRLLEVWLYENGVTRDGQQLIVDAWLQAPPHYGRCRGANAIARYYTTSRSVENFTEFCYLWEMFWE